MKLAIIADDLTGANDSGVQLAKYGLETSVLLKKSDEILKDDVVVFDTDSRSIDSKEALARVESVSNYLIDQDYSFIFKKIDSTMRGNIGQEMKGILNAVNSDFAFINPAYPSNNRQVINGHHYLNGELLHNTEIANDPLMPVKDSYIPDILKQQLNEEIGLVTYEDIQKGLEEIKTILNRYKENNVRYVVVDAKEENDLKEMLNLSKGINYTISWAGSAGLANYLPEFLEYKSSEKNLTIDSSLKPILTVIGSVNIRSREQLDYLLANEDVVSIEVNSAQVVSGEKEQQKEIDRVCDYVKNYMNKEKNVVIYTAGTEEDIERARKAGKKVGLSSQEVSKTIVKVLGKLSADLIQADLFQGLTATGGDTIKQVTENLEISGFQLFDELQTGVPIAIFKEKPTFYVITKAGGFGNDRIFVEANKKLKGEYSNVRH